MDMLNASKESSYEPGVFNDPSEAAEYVDRELTDEGADIVDIGPEPVNKRPDVLSAEDEPGRLGTVLLVPDSVSGDAVLSIETRYHGVVETALDGGFGMTNDICGFADPVTPRVCEEFDATVAKMASPLDLTRPGAIEEVDDVYGALRLNDFVDETTLDPAFGDWSGTRTFEHGRKMSDRLQKFRGYGYPILISINRRNFLRNVAGRSTEEALSASLAATSMAVEHSAHVIRIHDVKETHDAALIGHESECHRVRGPGDVSVEELDVTTTDGVTKHLDRVGANRDLAAESVVCVFELEGLGADDREALEAAAGNAGAVLAVDDTGALLVRTLVTLARLSTLIMDASDAPKAALETVEWAAR